MNHEQYVQKFNERWNGEYEVVGHYQSWSEPILIKHIKCGQVYSVGANYALKNDCKLCKKTQAFVNKFNDKWNGEYLLVSEFKGSTKNIKIMHNKCGTITEKPAGEILRYGCSICAREQGLLNIDTAREKTRLSDDEFKARVYSLTGDEYTFLEEYIDHRTAILVRHNTCGKEYKVTPSHFLVDQRRCVCWAKGRDTWRAGNSLGVKSIKKYLADNQIEFKQEVRLKNCRRQNPLPFDFGIYKDNNLICLLEYDGKQHFKSNTQFGGEETFQLVKEADKIKDAFCKAQGIPLIRISYKVKDIKTYLNDYLELLQCCNIHEIGSSKN